MGTFRLQVATYRPSLNHSILAINNCMGDCSICMCTTFCTPCQIYRTAEDLNKSGMLYCLLSCFMPCIPVLLLRGEAREKYGIEGTTMEDVGAAVCCGACT